MPNRRKPTALVAVLSLGTLAAAAALGWRAVSRPPVPSGGQLVFSPPSPAEPRRVAPRPGQLMHDGSMVAAPRSAPGRVRAR
jgi:hypothetical protein